MKYYRILHSPNTSHTEPLVIKSGENYDLLDHLSKIYSTICIKLQLFVLPFYHDQLHGDNTGKKGPSHSVRYFIGQNLL